MERGASVAHGSPQLVNTLSGFAAGDEFDIEIQSATETERALAPTITRFFPLLPDGLGFVRYALRGHARIEHARQGLATTVAFTVTSGQLAVGSQSTTLTAGRAILVTVLEDAAHPAIVASEGTLPDAERALLSTAFSVSPLFVPLARWIGPSAPRRLGEEWQVGVEQHGDREWMAESTQAPLVAQLDRMQMTADEPRFRVRSWVDGPVVARRLGDDSMWQRRRVTREYSIELARDRAVPLAAMSAHERLEFATPTSVLVTSADSIATIAAPHTEYTFDTISVRRTLMLTNLRRAERRAP